MFEVLEGFAADGQLVEGGGGEVGEDKALAGYVDLENEAAVDNVAFADADEDGSIGLEAFADEFFNVDKAGEQRGYCTVDEYDVAVVGVCFEVCHAVELHTHQLVAGIEVESGFGGFEMTHIRLSHGLQAVLMVCEDEYKHKDGTEPIV